MKDNEFDKNCVSIIITGMPQLQTYFEYSSHAFNASNLCCLCHCVDNTSFSLLPIFGPTICAMLEVKTHYNVMKNFLSMYIVKVFAARFVNMLDIYCNNCVEF